MLDAEQIIDMAKKGLTLEIRKQLMDAEEENLKLRQENLRLSERIHALEQAKSGRNYPTISLSRG